MLMKSWDPPPRIDKIPTFFQRKTVEAVPLNVGDKFSIKHREGYVKTTHGLITRIKTICANLSNLSAICIFVGTLRRTGWWLAGLTAAATLLQCRVKPSSTHNKILREAIDKTSQECETAPTSQYLTLFLVFVFLSFCHVVFLSFCLFVFLSFCLDIMLIKCLKGLKCQNF